MTKLVFKYSKLRNDLIPNLNNAIDELNKLKLFLDNMNIPNDFQYLDYLKNLDFRINSWKNLYVDFVESIEFIDKTLEAEFSDLHLSLNNIVEIEKNK